MQIKFSYVDLLLPHYFTKLAGHHEHLIYLELKCMYQNCLIQITGHYVHIISLELKCIYQNCLKDGQNLQYYMCWVMYVLDSQCTLSKALGVQ